MSPAQSSLAPCHRYPRRLPWDLAPEEPPLTRWHVEGLELGVSATAVRNPSDSRKVQTWLDSLDANPQKLMAFLCCPALSHLQRKESPLSGDDSPSPRGVPGAWTVNALVHGKGLTYLDASPHISFTLSFSKEKEMERKPLAGLLPYLLSGRWWWSWHGLSWGLYLSQQKPVLLSCHLTYLQWDCSQIHTHFGLKIIQKAWPSSPLREKPNQTRNTPTWSSDFAGIQRGKQWQNWLSPNNHN